MVDVEALEGVTLGQYTLRKLVGSGGMGAVYRGVQVNLKRDVAVKVLSSKLTSNADYVERFNREALIAASLEHAHIVPIYDFGIQDDINYVAMRLLTGGSLDQRFGYIEEKDRPLPSIEETLEVLRQIAGALDYAHSKGVVHRDIKASNVMFDQHGDAFVVDFGIARMLESTSQLTGTGMTLGTPSYMSPEQWRGEEATPASDQYSVGIMAFALLTGRLPFQAPNPHSLLYMHLNDPPPSPQEVRPGLGKQLDEVFVKVLAKKPEGRYDTVTDFTTALEEAVPDLELRAELNQKTGFFITTLPESRRIELTPSSEMDQPTSVATDVPPVQDGTEILTDDQMPFQKSERASWGRALLVGLVLLLFGGAGLVYTQAQQSPPRGPLVALGLFATATPTATLTPTVTPTATQTPTATPTSTPATPIAVGVRDNIVLRAGPSDDYAVGETLDAEQPVEIIGISEDDEWYEVETDGGEIGWVRISSSIDTAGDLQAVPVALAPTLTPTETLVPTETPTLTPTLTSTATPTSTSTPTLTPTSTSTDTPTPTDEPTNTPTPTASNTPTSTSSPTPTDKPTLTSTNTPTPTETEPVSTATESPQERTQDCPGALPGRLAAGGQGYVLEEDPRPLNLRQRPGTSSPQLAQVSVGTVFEVLRGPECQEGMAWYEITYRNRRGWIAEGQGAMYFVGPYESRAPLLPTASNSSTQSSQSDGALQDRVDLLVSLFPRCEAVQLDEDFVGEPELPWFEDTDSRGYRVGMREGRYALELQSLSMPDGADPVSWGSLQELELENGRVDAIVSASKFSPRDRARTGIWLRYQDETNFLAFMIDGRGQYRVARFEQGYEDLQDWTESDLIAVGSDAVNWIAVEAEGDTFAFFINGQPVTTVDDSTWPTGRLAFYGSTQDQPTRFGLEHIRVCGG